LGCEIKEKKPVELDVKNYAGHHMLLHYDHVHPVNNDNSLDFLFILGDVTERLNNASCS
jgi:hypothetical protein